MMTAIKIAILIGFLAFVFFLFAKHNSDKKKKAEQDRVYQEALQKVKEEQKTKNSKKW